VAVSVRLPIVVLMVAALCFAGCGGSGDDGKTTTAVGPTQEISGDWTGTLRQKGLEPFRIAVRISPDGTGRVAYTGIECGGNWTLKNALASSPPAAYNFRERITQGTGGSCKGTGVVSIGPEPYRAPKELGYGFFGGGIRSDGELHRTDGEGLKPVFDEAGVTPP
jgi:hypothetical protein